MTPYYRARRYTGGGDWSDRPPPRPPVIVECSSPGCTSTMIMPPGTPPEAQATRLEVADWTQGPDGPVCGVPHTGATPAGTRRSWWRRLLGGR